jgi:hypothetical protein
MIGKLKPKKTTIKTNNENDSIMKRGKRQRQNQDQATKISSNNESSSSSSSSSLLVLPNEIIRNIAIYFTVKKLESSNTRAIGCSSSSEHHELKACLIDSKSSWWISSMNEGSFRNGKGEEYVEFELDSTKIVRLSTVLISIPMLPTGPLSVRAMRLDCCTASNNNKNNNNIEQQWKPITPILTVENRNGWQRIELNEPIDAQYIRLVCLSNQASSLLENNEITNIDITDTHGALTAVGFFTVKFE